MVAAARTGAGQEGKRGGLSWRRKAERDGGNEYGIAYPLGLSYVLCVVSNALRKREDDAWIGSRIGRRAGHSVCRTLRCLPKLTGMQEHTHRSQLVLDAGSEMESFSLISGLPSFEKLFLRLH